ncbi:peptidoglycan DD-metalloendopeptidase family protein, partial [Candidatus Dojkabacteria bacterium]|nr:peptidoglycan DD-metalloendopeptidase family protein [Candidatus Dojkabacteria bacterium]
MTRFFGSYKWLIIVFAAVCLLGATFYLSPTVSAKTVDQLQSELEALQKKIDDLKNQEKQVDSGIANEQYKRNIYSSEINYLDGEIKKKELEIERRNTEIDKQKTEIELLDDNIEKTQAKVDVMEANIKELDDLVKLRLKSSYEKSYSNSVLDSVLDSDNSSKLYELLKYYESVRIADRTKLEEYRSKKDEIEKQKSILEENKIQQEKIAFAIEEEKNNLENLQDTLGAQIAWKEKLIESSKANQNSLEQTKETLSQEQIKAIKDFESTQASLFAAMNKIDAKVARPVKKGDVIGREGETGYSTGPHLHFIVDGNGDGAADNPCNYLPSGIQSGCGTSTPKISWPMKNTFYITSWYGWRWGSFHGALDIAYP